MPVELLVLPPWSDGCGLVPRDRGSNHLLLPHVSRTCLTHVCVFTRHVMMHQFYINLWSHDKVIIYSVHSCNENFTLGIINSIGRI